MGGETPLRPARRGVACRRRSPGPQRTDPARGSKRPSHSPCHRSASDGSGLGWDGSDRGPKRGGTTERHTKNPNPPVLANKAPTALETTHDAAVTAATALVAVDGDEHEGGPAPTPEKEHTAPATRADRSATPPRATQHGPASCREGASPPLCQLRPPKLGQGRLPTGAAAGNGRPGPHAEQTPLLLAHRIAIPPSLNAPIDLKLKKIISVCKFAFIIWGHVVALQKQTLKRL